MYGVNAIHRGGNGKKTTNKNKNRGETWQRFVRFELGAAAHAGRVERVHVDGVEEASELLDVAVFTVQSHLQLHAHHRLVR